MSPNRLFGVTFEPVWEGPGRRPNPLRRRDLQRSMCVRTVSHFALVHKRSERLTISLKSLESCGTRGSARRLDEADQIDCYWVGPEPGDWVCEDDGVRCAEGCYTGKCCHFDPEDPGE